MKKVLALGLAAVAAVAMSTAVVGGASAAPRWQSQHNFQHNNFPNNNFPNNNFPHNSYPHNYPHNYYPHGNYPHGYHRHWGRGPSIWWGVGPYYDYDYDYGYDYPPYPSYAYPSSSAHVNW